MNYRKLIDFYCLIPKYVRVLLFTAFSGFLVWIILNIIFPLRIDISYSPIILADDSTLLYSFLNRQDKWRMYTELNEITPELKKAIIFKEDKYFYYHPGINFFSIARAMMHNLKAGKRTSGASTITMQVARMFEPKQRTYLNKLKEIFRATQLEWKYSKDEIIQLYLNMVPFGSNIEGVKAASVIYFGKMPNHLSIGEIAALSIIPNRPVSLRLGQKNDYIVNERNEWLLKYQKAGLFPQSYISDAIKEPLLARRREIPKLAPQLSYRLKNSYPKETIIRSTISTEIQQKCESITNEYSKTLYFRNIKNAAVFIIDNIDHNVLAYVGSADYTNEEDGGQVDGIRAVRSPGSALKPLLYGIAIDDGLITPKSIISDVPISFSGYEPENYDGKYYGNITVENALATSLNIPAVKVLSMLKTNKMIEKLIDAGFKQIRKDKDNLGLSLILGGCGITLEEITTLYSCLANGGTLKKVRYIKDDPDTTSLKIISGGSAFMITEILTKIKRPDLPIQWDNSVHMPKIAWKTGTSYGRKDAWSIGYNKKYTIGVWIGNFSAEGVPELSGSEMATPLLFRLFNAIDYDSEESWFKEPDEIRVRYVCAQTGMVPNDFCDDLVFDYYLPGISGNERCNHMKLVYINPDSTISYCTSCKPALGYISALYPNLKPEIITYYEDNNILYRKIPTHNPDCERLMSGEAPRITSPINDNDYFVNVQDSMEILLSCQAANDVEKVYWYINKKIYKTALASERIFFIPNEGKIDISCSDDKGRNSDISIRVKYVNF
jgi:penicillin-binding protein 1C